MRSETHDPLLRALRLLELRPRRVLTAVAAGVATLGSALALAALSAWLITRAWEMPPVLDLSVAVVAVRALGISRGVFRYLERLTTHDVALRGTTAARSRIYQQLARRRSRGKQPDYDAVTCSHVRAPTWMHWATSSSKH